jgi:hypothetical protein
LTPVAPETALARVGLTAEIEATIAAAADPFEVATAETTATAKAELFELPRAVPMAETTAGLFALLAVADAMAEFKALLAPAAFTIAAVTTVNDAPVPPALFESTMARAAARFGLPAAAVIAA